jgi:hypothetical protein
MIPINSAKKAVFLNGGGCIVDDEELEIEFSNL